MPRVVCDTVVLVSAFITEHKRGVSAELLHAARSGAFSLHLSEAVLEETEGVLLDERRRLRRRYRYRDEAARRWVRSLAKLAHRVTDLPEVRAVERDPKDDAIVATAVAAEADYLVTRDKDLLALGRYREIEIVTPEAFMGVLRGR